MQALIIAAPALVALQIARDAGVVSGHVVPAFVRIAGVSVALFAVMGFGVTRLFLPDGLRRHEVLWILPTGAATTAFAMTPLGFAHIPFAANLTIVVLGGAALSVRAWRHHGLPQVEDRRAVAWPLYLACLLTCLALIPLFRANFLTVIGNGSDAHLAAGTAEFLKHAAPNGLDISLPVDHMPLVWRSKQAIYYAFAAVASLTGLETWQVLSVLGALLLTFGALGWFVFAREVLGTGTGTASVAMLIAGADRMVIHTGTHPYFNQTWGAMTVPFAVTLSWWVVGHPSRRAISLLGLFLIVCAFAYPLALPIPALALAVMWWVDRRRRQREGERLVGWRDGWQRFRTLPGWAQAVAVLGLVILLVPILGVFEKLVGASQLLLSPRYSLVKWSGDLTGWIPEQQFFGLDLVGRAWWAAIAVFGAFAAWQLWQLARPVRYGLLSVIVVAVIIAASMRTRHLGWYFHFKMLAFLGPLVIVLAVAGMARVRAGTKRPWVSGAIVLALVLWLGSAAGGAKNEIATTFDELSRPTQELRAWSAELPAHTSIRLDIEPNAQLWPAYMLADHPLCSRQPLVNTSYPHVPVSRAADYTVVRGRPEPGDATGPALFDNLEYQVFKLRPGLPGGDHCSQRMVNTVKKIQLG